MNYFQNYHKHTSFSHRYGKDSSLTYKDYFKYYKTLADQGIPTIYSTTEHGWQSPYFRVYNDLEAFNADNAKANPNYKPIKFVFGTEAYWVKDRFEKDSSNAHIILLAKNDNGRKKLNRAIYESFKSGYYYKNRMDLDILLSLPKDDIFVTSSCLAFWKPFIDELPFQKSYDFTEIDNIILQLNDHFTDFYLEVQSHNTPLQKELNQHMVELHNKYGIPLIAGTDSHMITVAQKADRDDLLKSNDIHYEDEDDWYMDLPSYDEFVQRFKTQGVLTDEEIYEALENTNRILDFEDIVLDRSLKVPIAKQYRDLTLEERNKVFEDILKREWFEQYDDIDESKIDDYSRELKHDIAEIEGCQMADYFIDSYEIMKRGQEVYGGILTPSGRGSAVSMFLNKLLRLTKVDKVTSPVLMYSERFLTKERVLDSKTPPDIDNNCSAREPFIQAQKDIIGEEGTFDLLALGTLKYKSAFKMYARAYNLDPQLQNVVTKQIDAYEEALKHKDEDDEIDIYDYVDKDKYEYLIEGCQDYLGIVDNLKGHPCASVCYSGDAIEDIGVIMVKSESQGENAKETFVAVIESATIDSFGYLKQDYLIVDSIGLTYDIYKEIGIEPLTVNQLLKTIDGDKKVWDIYAKGYTLCVNQCEQTKTMRKARAYKPQNISELTQFIAGIRPSFQSMYNIFESRQHFEYGIKAFDKLLQDQYCSSSFILYQESLMKVLGFADFPMSETYTIIKAISKKKKYVIDSAKSKFIPNFAQKILDTNETNDPKVAEDMARKVWQIIEDSARYGFNSAHAFCMAIDSVTLAWQKAYYPLEFYKVALQRYTDKGDKDKVALLKKEMKQRGISLKPIKFGDDNRTFAINHEEGVVNQTMGSIKRMEKITPNVVYEMGLHKDEYENLFFIFADLKAQLNKTSINMLFKLGYFDEYGDINYILSQWEVYKAISVIYERLKACKQLTKAECDKYGLDLMKIRECANVETPKLFKEIDNAKLMDYALEMYPQIAENISSNYPWTPIDAIHRIAYEVGYSGCSELMCESEADNIYVVIDTETNRYGTPFVNLYHVCDGTFLYSKINRKAFAEYPCQSGDIIKVAFKTQPKKVKVNDEWQDSDDMETIIKDYIVLERTLQ